METKDIFTLALGLQEPWHVAKVSFVATEGSSKELHLWLEFSKGAKFSINGSPRQTAYDTIDKTWRHLNFFQYRCYLHAKVPRIRTGEHSIEMVEVPWARPESGFTMLFEALVMLLSEQEMPMNGISKILFESAPRLWRVFCYWVKKGVKKIDMSAVKRIGVDETSKRKGHNYVTHFVDLDTRKTIFVTEGKDASTFDRFRNELLQRGGKVGNIEAVSMDMSPAFIAGATKNFPNAGIIFDKFHIFKALNEALDQVRKMEHNDTKLLKGHRFTLLYSHKNLSEKQKSELDTLLMTYPTIGKAYGFRESFYDIFDTKMPLENTPKEHLERWCKLVIESKIEPMVRFAYMVKSHLFGIETLLKDRKTNNGILEGLNSLIQLAKKRARGYANIENFMHMIYFVTGGLQLDYPHEML